MKATNEQILALALRFATRLEILDAGGEEVQKAIDNANHPFWGDVERCFKSETFPMITTPPRPRIEVLSETPKPCAERSIADQLASQRQLYGKFGWTFSDSGLVIPRRQKGFDRLLVMANRNLTNNSMYEVLEASFPCWRYAKDLNRKIPEKKDERRPCRGPYAIWVRDCTEADEVHKGESALMIVERDIKTLTVLERMYFEALFYWETGQHLDQQNVTLCSGSRDSDDCVPYMEWRSRLNVDMVGANGRFNDLRARQAVTF